MSFPNGDRILSSNLSRYSKSLYTHTTACKILSKEVTCQINQDQGDFYVINRPILYLSCPHRDMSSNKRETSFPQPSSKESIWGSIYKTNKAANFAIRWWNDISGSLPLHTLSSKKQAQQCSYEIGQSYMVSSVFFEPIIHVLWAHHPLGPSPGLFAEFKHAGNKIFCFSRVIHSPSKTSKGQPLSPPPQKKPELLATAFG